MVTGAKVDGAVPTISPGIRKTIQSIKEIVGNHSDADIYATLKETNMDPNETTQKLLYQDPFHEVKRKRSKNKENVGSKGPSEPSKHQQEVVGQGSEFNSFDQNNQRDDNYKMGENRQRGGYNQRGIGVVRRGGYIRRGDDDQIGDDAHKVDDIHKNDGFHRGDGNQRDIGVPKHDANQRDSDVHEGDKNLRGVGFHRGGIFRRGSGFQRGRGDDDQTGDSAHKVDDVHKNDGFHRGRGNLRDSSVPKHDSNQRDSDVLKGDGNPRSVGFHRGGTFPRGSGFQRGSGVQRGVTFQRDGFARNPLPGNPVKGVEFRVVRDNRVNQITSQDSSALRQCATSNSEEGTSNVSADGHSSETSNNQKNAAVRGSFEEEKVIESKGADERRTPHQSSNTQRQAGKSKDSRPRSAGQASNNSVLGVYSSSLDPVHVPSPARSSTNGTFRREVGVVGVRKLPTDNSGKQTSVNAAALPKSNPSAESVRPHNISPKGNQRGQNTATGLNVPVMSASRPLSNSNQYGHRSHQQPAGHQKAAQLNKEWKPKSSQKNAVSARDRMSTDSALPISEVAADGLKDSNTEAEKLSDKYNSQEHQGVIIAEHIRVPDVDRCRVTFGSFGLDANSTNFVAESQTAVDAVEFSGDLSASMPASDATDVDIAEQESPEYSAAAELADTKDSSPQVSGSYAEIGMVSSSDSTAYSHQELQKHHDTVRMGSLSAYDPQSGYDITYFRQSDDEAARGGLSSAQEGFNSHATGMIPASQALYQQQAQIAQMYPQVHVSHYMPYRQFIPPVYVPPMGMPGYAPNTAYAHPANGNGYVLMPGGSSHLNVNAMKYGAQQQFKPAPGGSPTGFGTYTAPGYTVTSSGGMMGATGTDDSSRLKYKDGNLYIQNPQADAQEMWIQNAREIPGLQSSPYYNMQGQSPHGTYMASHPGHHAAYNSAGAVAQSSHIQFPGVYHPQAQAAPIPNPHHMAQANVGVGVPQAVGAMAQVGSYQQQPQMNHLQWTSNTF